MGKMVQLEDGSIDFPLRPGPGDPERSIVLPEPSIRILAAMQKMATQADATLNGQAPMTTTAPTIAGRGPTPEDVTQSANYQAELSMRAGVIFNEESPHGKMLVEWIKLLTGDELTIDDLYGWSCSPRTANQILTWFQAPLLG